MSVLIEDNGNLLDITVAGEKHSLPKSSIELNVWDGHLIIWSFMRERYRFAYGDVTSPSCASAELLRDAVSVYLNNQEVNLVSPLTAFGELLVGQETAYIQNTGAYNLLPANFRSYSGTGGSTSVADRLFTCESGTTLYGYGAIQSLRSLNYNAGQGGYAKFTMLFESPIANSWSGVGLVNLSDELSFGHNGTTFGIWHRYGGVAECRTITVTGASGGSTDLTLTLNGVAYTIPLTAGTTAKNASEISTWLNANQTVWGANQLDNTVIIIAQSDGAKSGTYSFSHASATGTITQNKAGVTKTSNHIPQSTWNKDVCSWLDTTKGNVAKIYYQYLGFGNCFFFLENPDTGKFVLVHILKWTNTSTRTSLNQPSLRFGMYAYSVGSTSNVVVKCASVGMGVQGKVQKTRNPRAVKNTQTVSTSFTNVLTLRNRRTYNSLYNQVEIEPIIMSLASESSKNVEIELRTNVTFTGNTNYTTAGNQLVGDIDTTSNTYSNGTLLASFTIGANGANTQDIERLSIRIPPTIALTIGARVTSGASANVTAALTYYEDL